MKKPQRPTAMTMCRIRGMMGGEACRSLRWVSNVVKCAAGVGRAVQRRG